jgi:hypothetical protein
MTDVPLHLLASLASKQEQVRHVTNGTKDEYLIPEDLLNDAFHFCERVREEILWLGLSARKRAAILEFQQNLSEKGSCIDRYDHSTIGELIERDLDWAVLRDGARDLLRLLGSAP